MNLIYPSTDRRLKLYPVLSFLVCILITNCRGEPMSSIYAKRSNQLFLFYPVSDRNCIPRSYFRNIYCSLVQSNYLTFVWGRASRSTLQPLVVLQNWSFRALFRYGKHHPVRDMYPSNRILPLNSYIQYTLLFCLYTNLSIFLFLVEPLSLWLIKQTVIISDQAQILFNHTSLALGLV